MPRLCAILLLAAMFLPACGREAPPPRTTPAEPVEVDVPTSPTLVRQGRQLFDLMGCDDCHSTRPNQPLIGPPLAGLFGQQVQLQDGGTVIADLDYFEQSVLDPNAHFAAGYDPAMPPYRGRLTEQQIRALAAYIDSLPTAGPPTNH